MLCQYLGEKNVKCNTMNKSHKHYRKSDTKDCHSKESLTKRQISGCQSSGLGGGTKRRDEETFMRGKNILFYDHVVVIQIFHLTFILKINGKNLELAWSIKYKYY